MVKRPPVRPYHIAWCLIRRCAEPAQRQPNYCFQTATKGQSCKPARSDYAIIPGEQPLSHYGLGGPSPRRRLPADYHLGDSKRQSIALSCTLIMRESL
jgi:hypothetical protein